MSARRIIYMLLAAAAIILVVQVVRPTLQTPSGVVAVTVQGLTGRLEVRATAQHDNQAVIGVKVDIGSVEVHVPNGWIALKMSDTTSFDLLKLTGFEQLLASDQIPPGYYSQVRLGIKKVVVTTKDGQTREASLPGKRYTFSLRFPVTPPGTTIGATNTTVLVFEFNIGNCIEISPVGKATFQPVIRLLATPTPGAMSIITAGLPDGEVGQNYDVSLSAIGGQAPYSWSISLGNLPPGITLDSATGTLSGMPISTSFATVTMRVEDSSPNKKSATKSLTFAIVAEGALKILSSNLPEGNIGVPYSARIQSAGGTAPYSFSLTSGTFPAGFELDKATGTISITPVVKGDYTFTVRVTDGANPAKADSKSFTLIIADAIVIEK